MPPTYTRESPTLNESQYWPRRCTRRPTGSCPGVAGSVPARRRPLQRRSRRTGPPSRRLIFAQTIGAQKPWRVMTALDARPGHHPGGHPSHLRRRNRRDRRQRTRFRSDRDDVGRGAPSNRAGCSACSFRDMPSSFSTGIELMGPCADINDPTRDVTQRLRRDASRGEIEPIA